ncbi:MAG: hypothetical protein WBE80_16315 [Methylocella sp.]
MVDAPDNPIFKYLRRLDTTRDRVIEDLGELKIRMTAVEERLARTDVAIANPELPTAAVNRRIDRVDARLDRIERRLDLVELPH